MEKILEQLYKGELYPYSTFQTTIEDFKENRDKAFASYSSFLEKLPDNFKEEFVQLIDTHLDLLPYELEQNFIDGFRIGARMMTEVFQSPNTEEPA
ncbi:MAG: DUF6809 family protein [Lachnospiraceae bacterium]